MGSLSLLYLPCCCKIYFPIKKIYYLSLEAMVSLLFGIESTTFSLVCSEAQTPLPSLSYCHCVSSVLCLLAPEFSYCLNLFWTFVYFFFLLVHFTPLHHAHLLSLVSCWPPETPVSLSPSDEKTPLFSFSFFLLVPTALWTSVLTLVYLFTCLSLSLSNKSRWDWGTVSGAKEACWCFFPSLRWNASFDGLWQACEISKDFGGYTWEWVGGGFVM